MEYRTLTAVGGKLLIPVVWLGQQYKYNACAEKIILVQLLDH